jgi:DNA-binding FrmR family transcriptional regulator
MKRIHEPMAESHPQRNEGEHEHTKQVVHRLSRAIGHMEAVKKMILEGRDCSDVLIQIAAVKSAVNNIGKAILQDHIDHCIVPAVQAGENEAVVHLHAAIDKFMK